MSLVLLITVSVEQMLGKATELTKSSRSSDGKLNPRNLSVDEVRISGCCFLFGFLNVLQSVKIPSSDRKVSDSLFSLKHAEKNVDSTKQSASAPSSVANSPERKKKTESSSELSLDKDGVDRTPAKKDGKKKEISAEISSEMLFELAKKPNTMFVEEERADPMISSPRSDETFL